MATLSSFVANVLHDQPNLYHVLKDLVDDTWRSWMMKKMSPEDAP